MTVFSNRIRREYLWRRTVVEMAGIMVMLALSGVLWTLLLLALPAAVDAELDMQSRHAAEYVSVLGGGR